MCYCSIHLPCSALHLAHLPGCLSKNLLSYASGRSLTDGEDDAIRYHTEGFEGFDYSVLELLRDVAMSPAFRMAGGE